MKRNQKNSADELVYDHGYYDLSRLFMELSCLKMQADNIHGLVQYAEEKLKGEPCMNDKIRQIYWDIMWLRDILIAAGEISYRLTKAADQIKEGDKK